MSLSRRAFLVAGGAVAVGASVRASTGLGRSGPSGAAARAGVYTLEPAPAGKTLKDADGRVVLSYLTSKPADVPLAGNSVCCVHPFNTMGGTCATDIAPPDHRDHRGLFFAWHDMTFSPKGGQGVERRADFWGWGQFAPTAGRVIRNRSVRLASAGAESGELAVTNDWMIDADTVLQEETTIRAAVDQGARVLDLTYRFSSDEDVTLNRMAFTGFCFRCRKDGPYVFADTHGEVTLPNSVATRPDTDWPARDWYSHTVTHADGTVTASAVIDHPRNPPSLWHGARSVSFLNPCIAAPGPVRIPAGQTLALRYRAVAHDGPFPDGWMDRMAARWRAE